MKFVLPYIIVGQPAARNFIESDAPTIQIAAATSELFLREKYTKLLNRRVCVAVAEIDFTYLDRETGKPLPRPEPRPVYRRRRRYARYGRV